MPKSKTAKHVATSLDIDVYVDELPVATMRVSINFGAESQRRGPISDNAAWFEEIFASYAREDIKLVEHLKKRYAALGLNLFIDVEDLQVGVKWRPELFRQIDSSDLFQLFWSSNSKASKNVEVEWRHALQVQRYNGGRFIRPVYWEQPMPTPPSELADLNFRPIRFWEDPEVKSKK